MEGHGRFTEIGKTYGIGVIGLGEGKGLVKGLSGHPELHVKAVCDTDPNLLSQVQHDFSIENGYAGLDDMAARDDIDIIAIYTPDEFHIDHIETAFSSGKHVVCTKPLVNSLKEADKIIKLVEQYPDSRLMVGQSSRFFGSMREQRKAFENGKLGDLSFIEAHYVHDMRWFYNNREWAKQGNFDLIFGGCSHPVDLVRWYMGDVEEVSAYSNRSLAAEEAGFNGRDTFIINLQFTNKRIGRVLGLFGLEQPHQYRPWIEVSAYGSNGTFIAQYPQLESLVKYKDEHERKESYFEDIYHYFQFEGVNHHAGEFVNYVEYFAKSLTTGQKASPDAYDGYNTIATLEAIRQSIETNKPVKVKNISID